MFVNLDNNQFEFLLLSKHKIVNNNALLLERNKITNKKVFAIFITKLKSLFKATFLFYTFYSQMKSKTLKVLWWFEL